MVHTQPFSEQRVLRRHHVIIIVMRETGVQSVAWLRGFSMTDPVRQDDEILRRIEQAAGPEQHVGELRSQELVSISARAMQNENSVGDATASIAFWCSQRGVVQPQLGQALAGAEPEIPEREVSFSCIQGERLSRAGTGQHHHRE